MTFVRLDVEVDPRALQAQKITSLVNQGIALDRAGLVEAIALSDALQEHVTRLSVIDMGDRALGAFGTKLAGVARVDPAAATAESTWTMVDNAGYTIPAGTVVTYPVSGSERIPFVLADSLTIDPGDTTATGIEIRAVQEGTVANGLLAASLDGPGLAHVQSVVTTTTTSGGAAGDTDLEYLSRVSARMRLSSDAAITEADFSTFAVQLSVAGRARGRANYDAENDLEGQPDHFTIYVTDDDGEPLSSDDKDTLADFFDTIRMVDTVVHIADAAYVPITIAYTALAADDADPAVVEAAADAAIAAHLSAAADGWRDSGTDSRWTNDTVVRYFDLVGVLQDVTDLYRLDSLTLNGGVVDVDLTAGGDWAPLPDPTINGTVT